MVSIISKTHSLRYPNLENWNTVFGTESLHMLVTGIRWLASGACHPRTECRPRARRPATWFRHGVPDGMFFADGMVTRRGPNYHTFSVRWAFTLIIEGPPKSLWDVVFVLASVLVKRLEKSSSVGFLVFLCGGGL